MSAVQMFWSLCAKCVKFLSQRRSGAVLMDGRHGEDQTDKQGPYQRKRSDRVLATYIRYVDIRRTDTPAHAGYAQMASRRKDFDRISPESFLLST